ncbi:hypothetical protein [Rothia dentocariosa]
MNSRVINTFRDLNSALI